MELSAEYGRHVERVRGLVEEIATHHRAACDAADSGNKAALGSAHTRLGRCIRSAQVTFAKMAADAVASDMAKNHETQNSGGMGEGTSSPPRAAHPLLQGDVAGWVGRAFGGK
jgi:hypothetical protein